MYIEIYRRIKEIPLLSFVKLIKDYCVSDNREPMGLKEAKSYSDEFRDNDFVKVQLQDPARRHEFIAQLKEFGVLARRGAASNIVKQRNDLMIKDYLIEEYGMKADENFFYEEAGDAIIISYDGRTLDMTNFELMSWMYLKMKK